jgi:hypothetical protein
MDAQVVRSLEDAGIDVTFTRQVPAIAVQVDKDRRPMPLGREVLVLTGDLRGACPVRLKAIPELYAGTAEPPDMSDGPPAGYEFFFALIERTAADFCVSTRRIETDAEMHRLYRLLSRRPDAQDANPLFSHLQGAARLYMSLRDVSRAECGAVTARLALFARNVRVGSWSTNYIDSARRLLR